MLTRKDKEGLVAGLSERFGRAKAAFLIDFKGLNVEKVTKLRKTLYPLQAEMKVVRNTLAKRALKDHPESEAAISEDFVETNAIVFAFDDASAPAKALKDFTKEAEELEVKSGVMEGKRLDENMIKYLSTLPAKEVLQAQFLGVLQAPMGKFVRTLNEVPSSFVRVLNAKKEQGE